MPDITKALTVLEGSIRKSVTSARRTFKSFSCTSFFSDGDADRIMREEDGASIFVEPTSRSATVARTARSDDSSVPDVSLPVGLQAAAENSNDSARSSGPSSATGRTNELLELGFRMSKNVELKDRQWHWKIFKNCFLGEEAVSWMISEGIVECVEEAVELGNRMIESGVIRHVTEDQRFENQPLFYRFTEVVIDDDDGESATDDSLPAKLMAIGEELIQTEENVAELHSQLKLHRQLNIALFESGSEQQQRLECMIECQSAEIAKLEYVVVLQTFVVAFMILAMLGWWAAPLGCLLIGVAGYMGHKAWFHESSTMHKKYHGAHGVLLKRLQDASNFPEQPSTCDLQTGNRWSSAVCSGSRPCEEPGASSRSRSMELPDKAKAARPEPAKRRFIPQAADYENWPDRPCLFALNTSYSGQRATRGADPDKIRVNTGEPFHFESNLFKGQAVMWVAGLDSTPKGLFQGQRRVTHLAVQGRFKKELDFTDVFTGQEFLLPLKHLPAMSLFSVLLKLGKRLSPSLVAGMTPVPHILTPIAAAAQMITINRPGEEKSINSPPQEDMRVLGTQFCKGNGEPISGPHRKKMMSDVRNRTGRKFDTEHVYTFHFWQHLLDLSTFELDLNIKQFSLSRHLGGQPLQLMAKTKESGDVGWRWRPQATKRRGLRPSTGLMGQFQTMVHVRPVASGRWPGRNAVAQRPRFRAQPCCGC
ncbi:unnamed protein product [Ostreobium quekettii]|uniref:DEP domain-containing protein n=1 Tax=Ostreobium quekettii TaxID=121088 RepID=A0A8S1JAV9_9CHLO|nr:unnamed protein product [Ostreobium quekettii]